MEAVTRKVPGGNPLVVVRGNPLVVYDAGVSEHQLQRVRNPIGLDLGGETAADIALSIVSEVIAIMHGRSGSPLRAKKREAVVQPT